MRDILLLIEDEKLLGSELIRHLSGEGWDVVHAEDLGRARRALVDEGLEPLVVLSDMNLPDGTALDLLEEVHDHTQSCEWLFLTGYGTVADSVRALRLGAYDFLEKPCPLERLDLVITAAARSARAQRRLSDQTAQLNHDYSIDAFIGQSKPASDARDLLKKLTQVPFSALIVEGETGTGKGLATRILHHCGLRRNGPLVELNCAALPHELLESELFGHEAGAFTGARKRRRGLVEQASGGTLFLDEISEMDLDLQAKLLKMIEDQKIRPLGSEREIEVDVQIVAASNRSLHERSQSGDFREDLYHRLSVFGLTLPSLRVRPDDLDDMVPMIIAEYNAKSGKRIRVIPDEIWQALKSYNWPGNVRELRNVIERSVLLSENEVFPSQWLQFPVPADAPPPSSVPQPGKSLSGSSEEGEDHIILPLDGSMSLEDMDRYIVGNALERSGFNVTAAARMLGTTRQTLRYRAQKYGLKLKNSEESE
jgi:two-component system response regulator AtoC